MRYRTTAILFSLVLFAAPAFAHMSAGELSLNCDAVTAEAEWMRDAVKQFSLGGVRKLAGDASLSTPNNPVAWIADDGSARQFTAYEIQEGI